MFMLSESKEKCLRTSVDNLQQIQFFPALLDDGQNAHTRTYLKQTEITIVNRTFSILKWTLKHI